MKWWWLIVVIGIVLVLQWAYPVTLNTRWLLIPCVRC